MCGGYGRTLVALVAAVSCSQSCRKQAASHKWRGLLLQETRNGHSASINLWWVTFDAAKTPLLPERNMLCTEAIEYKI